MRFVLMRNLLLLFMLAYVYVNFANIFKLAHKAYTCRFSYFAYLMNTFHAKIRIVANEQFATI